MSFKCKGGMMDCDADRREFARKQIENLAARAAGLPTADTSCKVEEACTTDILGVRARGMRARRARAARGAPLTTVPGAAPQAAVSGLNGFTTGEKLAKMGRDPTTAVNSTAYVPPGAADE